MVGALGSGALGYKVSVLAGYASLVDRAQLVQGCKTDHATRKRKERAHWLEYETVSLCPLPSSFRLLVLTHVQAGQRVFRMPAAADKCNHLVDVVTHSLPFRVMRAQRHSRRPHDYYTLTLLADIAAFLYAAITYRMVVSVALGMGTGTNGGSNGDALSELGDTSATVLPIDYVLALMVLFGLTVAERTVNTVAMALVCGFMIMVSALQWLMANRTVTEHISSDSVCCGVQNDQPRSVFALGLKNDRAHGQL
eukprot:1144660-Pelagomonas_calceolata.AAC.5